MAPMVIIWSSYINTSLAITNSVMPKDHAQSAIQCDVDQDVLKIHPLGVRPIDVGEQMEMLVEAAVVHSVHLGRTVVCNL